MKTLYFEGAGCVHAYGNSDVENCRIRTAFKTDSGKMVYLEMLCNQVTKYNYQYQAYEGYKMGDCIGWVDSCHYITDDPEIDDCNASRTGFEHTKFLFTKANILQFINEKLNCSFDEVVILNELTGYRVFKDTMKLYGTSAYYNFGDEFQYDDEKTIKRLTKMKELKAYFEQFMQYDNSSYWVDDNGDLVVRINTYDSVFKQMKYKERQFTVKIG